MGVLVLLGLLAWWTFRVVSLPPLLRNLFDEDEAVATAATPPSEEEVFQKELARLPPPPETHDPQVADLIARLRVLPMVPTVLVRAVERDQATPKDQTPAAWSEEELTALKDYQEVFRNAWEPFLSGPRPAWGTFPFSAIFFRSHFPRLSGGDKNLFHYGFYRATQPETWRRGWENEPEFIFRFSRQCSELGMLRFGTLGGWALLDATSLTAFCEETIRNSDFFFTLPPSQDPETLLALAPVPPTIETLRQGLQVDRVIFLKSAEYLQSLPPGTPATVALTRLWENKSDAEWFLRRANDPKTAQELAEIFRMGADQVGSFEQKTYLSGPAWRQWLAGDLNIGIHPLFKDAWKGLQEFEQKNLEYRVALAFLRASAAYRQSGLEGMRNIPDPARPGSFLTLTSSTNDITLSSALPTGDGGNYRFTLEIPAAP